MEFAQALDYASAILDAVPKPMLILGADLRVARANRAFYAAFKVTPDLTEGRFVHEVGDGQWDMPVLREALQDLLEKDARLGPLHVEHDFPHMGHRTLVLEARKVSYGRSGQESILVLIDDRTEIPDAERESERRLVLDGEARQRSQEAQQVQNELVATISHELRGPLSSMAGWVHLLRWGGGADHASFERALAAIERGVKAQTRLVEDLLDYSRLVMGKLHLARRPTDLLVVAQSAAESVRAAAEEKGISLELAGETGLGLVLGDPDRLQQIVWNLLSNAVKFTRPGGTINVSVRRVGTLVRLQVRDTGQGIRREFLPHLFERFRQADGSSRGTPGLGLGLAIVKQLVEQHRGTVQADSPGEGLGATFTVALPVSTLLQESVDPAGASAGDLVALDNGPERRMAILRRVRVLVVEDDADGREMLAAVLEQHGAQVTQASSASEAMQALEQETPDVLVCDLGLPGEDGHQFMRRVRSLPSARGGTIPALALTAYGAADDRRKALAAGFDVHLAKPAAPAEFVAVVAALAMGAGGG